MTSGYSNGQKVQKMKIISNLVVIIVYSLSILMTFSLPVVLLNTDFLTMKRMGSRIIIAILFISTLLH